MRFLTKLKGRVSYADAIGTIALVLTILTFFV